MIISHNKLIEVSNIIERDNISIKTRGTRVQVIDASLDERTSGSAIYFWNGSVWVLENEDNEKHNIDIISKLQSDDVDLDTIQEIVDYIKNLQSQIDDLNERLSTERFLSVIG